jgi:pilus assembly protein Flp/PilA
MPWHKGEWLPTRTMKAFVKRIGRFLRAEDGPTTVEYAVLLALIIVFCLTAIHHVGNESRKTFRDVDHTIRHAN